VGQNSMKITALSGSVLHGHQQDAPIRRTRSGRKKFVISDADLRNLREMQRSLAPLKAAARYSGMSSKRIRALVKTGLIVSTGVRIDTNSIDRLLGSIMANCVLEARALKDPISLAEALRLYVPIERSAVFFDRLTNGDMHVSFERSTVSALRKIFADRGEVIAIAKTPLESSPEISIVEAARRLGIKQEVMYHLVNIGLLRTRIGKLGRRSARVVDVDVLEKFAEQFVPLIIAAKAMKISAREAPRWARQRGIEIVSGPSVDGGRQYWIRKPVGFEMSGTSATMLPLRCRGRSK